MSMGDIPHLRVGNSYFSMALLQMWVQLWEVLHVGVVNCDPRVSYSLPFFNFESSGLAQDANGDRNKCPQWREKWQFSDIPFFRE
jgi:hypothetical protein